MKNLIVSVAITLMAFASQAEYLLWFTVSNNDSGYDAVTSYLAELKAAGTITDSDDVYANVVAVNDKQEKMGSRSYGLTSEWQIDAPAGKSGVSVSLTDLLGSNVGSASSYSYYIEIASSRAGVTNPIGYNQQATSYADLVSAGSITDSMAAVPAAAVWHGGSGSYKAAPEPTSAMLMLLGVAGLALRRKQRKTA